MKLVGRNIYAKYLSTLKKTLIRWHVTNKEADEFIKDFVAEIDKIKIPIPDFVYENNKEAFYDLNNWATLAFYIEEK